LPVAGCRRTITTTVSHRSSASAFSRRLMPTRFQDLEVFKRARLLVKEVYAATAGFPSSEMYGLTAQMRRAALSVLSHLAEGQGRLTYGEWRQMLSHARGSLYEVEAQCVAGTDLGFLTDSAAANLQAKTQSVGRALAGLIRWVRSREAQSKPRRQPATRQPGNQGGRQPQ